MKEKKKEYWTIYFEPKKDITTYELAIIVQYWFQRPPGEFRKDWENGTLSDSVKRHIRIEIREGKKGE